MKICIPLAVALLAPVELQGWDVSKPEPVDLQGLAGASIVIKFTGKIVTEGESQYVEYIQSLPAEDSNQKIEEIGAWGGGVGGSFSYKIEKDGSERRIVLRWEKVPAGEIPYEIRVKVSRESYVVPIKGVKRGKAPAMLVHGTLTATNAEMKKKAFALVAGAHSDLEAALRLAAWINEAVQYDRNYSQERKDKPAPVVFKNRRGTCDEISHLFISMARSVGLPAREVSGVAFSGTEWGFHSWAEVKLEDQWVPFDVTNMQIGFVDPTHVAFTRDVDDARVWQEVRRVGLEGTSFTLKDHTMEVRIWKTSPLRPPIKLKFEVHPPEIPPGRKFKLAATISNESDFWVVGPVRIGLPEGFSSTEGQQKVFLLAPGKQTTLEWEVTSGGTFDPGKIYVINFGAVTFPKTVGEAKLVVATRIIEAPKVLRNPDGTVAIEVSIRNLFEEKKKADLEACLYSSWEMTKKMGCVPKTVELEARGAQRVKIESGMILTGNFAVELLALSGGLSQRLILKVDGGGS